MATRMQQRRGTAAQWISTNTGNGPILAPGEIGFESDTNKFKIGDGINHWVDLTYFTDADSILSAVSGIVDGAPDLLNTLNELAAALGDDPNFLAGMATTTYVDTAIGNIDALPSQSNNSGKYLTTDGTTASWSTVDLTSKQDVVSGVSSTEIGYLDGVTSSIQTQLNAKLESSNLSGYATESYVDTAVGNVTVDLSTAAGTNLDWNASTSQFDVDSASLLTNPTISTGLILDGTGDFTISSDSSIVLDATVINISAGTGDFTISADANIILDAATKVYIGSTSSGNEVATKSYADSAAASAAAAIVDAAPDTLNTLNELAAAINDDASYAATITTALGQKAPLDSPTFTGTVSGITKAMVGLANVNNTSDANKPISTATQSALDLKAPIDSPIFTGTVTLPGAPTQASHAATKAYVDNIAAGLNFHAAVHAATTANLAATYNNGTAGVGATLTSSSNGSLTVDNHAMLLNERILVKNQTTGSQNGIYVVSTVGDGSNPWVLTRATDADNSPTGEIAYGDFCFVQDGSTNGGYGYILNTTGTVTIGTTALSYTQFNTGQSVIAGNGLVEAIPGTFAIDTNVTQTRVANVSDTEIGYLDGVTSSIQTQLDAKIAKSDITAKGAILVGTGSGTYSAQTVGTNGQVLTANSAQADGVEWTTLPITSSNTAITSNSAVTIDTIPLTDFVTAEYQVTIHQGTSTRSSKVLVQTDGTSVDYNEYAIMATGTAIPGVTVAASVSSTNMVLQATITNGATSTGRAFIIKSITTPVAPAAPTIGTATYGDAQATVTFTPQDNGGSVVTSYTVTSNPGNITASGSSSPITVTGLTNLTNYTFTVTATNKYGTSSPSAASNSITPTTIIHNNYNTLTVTGYANETGTAVTSIARGAKLRILATGIDTSDATTQVTFGGNEATYYGDTGFTVTSSYIQVIVPTGAQSGQVTVDTAKGSATGASLTVTG